MVQVIENHADVDGRVVTIAADRTKADRRLVTLSVTSTRSVDGYPNMFSELAGHELSVLLPAELASGLKEGAEVRCRIRRAGPNVVIGEDCAPSSAEGR